MLDQHETDGVTDLLMYCFTGSEERMIKGLEAIDGPILKSYVLKKECLTHDNWNHEAFKSAFDKLLDKFPKLTEDGYYEIEEQPITEEGEENEAEGEGNEEEEDKD